MDEIYPFVKIRMKTRVTFVSNSSSSSFVVRTGTHGYFENILDLTKFIIKHTNWQDPREMILSLTKQLSEYNKFKTKLDFGITFPSCNYDTYILPDPNDPLQFLVETTHHNDGEVYEYLGDGVVNRDEDYITEAIVNSRFLILPYNVFGVPVENQYGGRETCKKCYDTIWKLDSGEVKCLRCSK